MSNLFLESKSVKCNYAVVRLNNKKMFNEKLVKTLLQSHTINDKDYISLEDIVAYSGSKICKNIEPEYIVSQINENDVVILSLQITKGKTRSKVSPKKICGLILLKIKPTYLFVSLVCGLTGLGKQLLNIIESVAKSYNLKKIKLHSVDDAAGFYFKYGYTFDRGKDVYTLGEPDKERKPKKISNIPPKKINGHNIDLGYIHKETHGKYKYSWILVEEDGLKRWKFIKPSYIQLNKYSNNLKTKLINRKPVLISKRELKTKGRSKKLLNSGIITTLRNVKLTNDGDDEEPDYTVNMTKKL